MFIYFILSFFCDGLQPTGAGSVSRDLHRRASESLPLTDSIQLIVFSPEVDVFALKLGKLTCGLIIVMGPDRVRQGEYRDRASPWLGPCMTRK